jgi:hypothetical protein
MNVEIGTGAAQFPEKEYINGIPLAVWAESYHFHPDWNDGVRQAGSEHQGHSPQALRQVFHR